MAETEISKINNKICDKIKSEINKLLREVPDEPRRVIKRWPAIILAVNRMAKVKGRINKLIVSMITIKGINKRGVPWGVR
jgi:hypothetical protein